MMTLWTLVALLIGIAIQAQDTPPETGQTDLEAGTFRNPLNDYGGADPWLTYYDGNYYLATTTWASYWAMRKSPTLAGLKTAEPIIIYHETDPSRCCNFWAPEFYLLDGPDGPRWYFYYTAGVAANQDSQHTHVLESEGTDPLGPYTYKGRLYDASHDVWAIDGSVLQYDDALYFLYSIWDGPDQSIAIAPMSNPWTLSGPGTIISQPEYDWETRGLRVNEAPVALQHDDDTFIVYSASFCGTPDYKLGLLELSGDDPLDAAAWEKHPEPVFQQSEANGVYGPGHNGFFMSPDGSEYWLVYHANDATSYGCDGRRSTRAQPFTWNEDGTPNFGVPVSTAEAIAAPAGDMGIDPMPTTVPSVRFAAAAMEGAYLSHSNFYIEVGFSGANSPDSEFRIVPGLADEEAVSIESVNFPGFYLHQQNNAVVLSAYDGSDTYEADSTWWLQPGLADDSGISFESYSQPGLFIGRRMGLIALTPLTDEASETEREDATFYIEPINHATESTAED
ncbi:family 43 glycosylhydrolase [Phototrophicus methaneseepsis]|nr:family 43 glycosylhydrolase [Phototrophicus methaneseepsis]